MAKRLLKQKAIELRKAGQSYSQIRQQLGVSKSTLSVWLEDLPLPEERIRELRDWSAVRIERYRETRRKNRETILCKVYDQEHSKIFPMSAREEFLCGLFLYWGEGLKVGRTYFSLSNTDFRMMRFFIYWAKSAMGVHPDKFVIKLHLYSDMDAKRERSFWSRTLGIPYSQFRKPYIKKSSLRGLTHKNGFGHGTCNVAVYDAMLCKRILMGLKSIGDTFGNVEYNSSKGA
jgi:hypothetical protein